VKLLAVELEREQAVELRVEVEVESVLGLKQELAPLAPLVAQLHFGLPELYQQK
jgi:hypothetical protein